MSDNDPRPRAGMTDVLERQALEWGNRCPCCTFDALRTPGGPIACCIACRRPTRTHQSGWTFVLGDWPNWYVFLEDIE